MKNFIKTLVTSVTLFSCIGQLAAQPNEATIFVLENDNLNEVVAQVSAHMNTYAGSAPPSAVLSGFFSKVYQNRVYTYNPPTCPEPAIRVFKQDDQISFRFDNFGSGYPDALFITELEYGGQMTSTEAVYGPEGYNGIDFPSSEVYQHIFLVGSFCSACQSSFINHCASKWEIIIIDKNIL